MLYGRKLERLNDSRLVKVIMEKMQDCGSVSLQGEYYLLLRKYGLEGSVGQQKSRKRGLMRETAGIGWKSSLKVVLDGDRRGPSCSQSKPEPYPLLTRPTKDLVYSSNPTSSIVIRYHFRLLFPFNP